MPSRHRQSLQISPQPHDRISSVVMHPVRRLLGALMLGWGLQAQALTLGPAVVGSSLGEPLRVEFPITRLSAIEGRDLQARLADERAYATARLERSPVLDGLEVSLQSRTDGTKVLVVRGQQAVHIPFVDLLIELRWANGRLLRDLTVLLQAQATDKAPSLPPSRLVVQPGDTAGQLARDHKDDNVSLEQMLVALLKQNPEAFVEDNVNRLRTGAVLSLPSAAEAGSLDREAAREALQQQAEAFDNWRAGLAQRVTASDAPDAADGARLQMPSRSPSPGRTEQDRLELSKPGSGTEDRIALQRQALDTAERAAELARNITELNKLAGGKSPADSDSASGVPLPAPDTPSHGRLIDVLGAHPLTPVAAGTLVALLVLMSLWRTRVRASTTDPRALPPLRPLPDIDLNLPVIDSPLSDEQATNGHTKRSSEATSPIGTIPAASSPRPTPGLPFAGLSLELPEIPEPSPTTETDAALEPLRVRLELASALWAVGQQHTARALAEEVAEQSFGDLQRQARAWLAERS